MKKECAEEQNQISAENENPLIFLMQRQNIRRNFECNEKTTQNDYNGFLNHRLHEQLIDKKLI